MAHVDKAETDPSSDNGKIDFHYLKSNLFRVVHADGAVGGPDPTARTIHVAVYNERIPIPVQATHEIREGQLGKEVDRVARSGVVREVEVDIVMDVKNAEVLGNWLLKQVEQVKNLRAEDSQ